MYGNSKIFEKLANFDLNPNPAVTLPVVNYVLKRMPTEIADELLTFANTHLRLCQYEAYEPDTNPNPQLSFWQSVYALQLGLIEDYECPECPPVEDDAIIPLLSAAAGFVAAGVSGTLSNVWSLKPGVGGWLLPGESELYIYSVTSVVKAATELITTRPYTFVTFGGVDYFSPAPVTTSEWASLPAGTALQWKTRWAVGSERLWQYFGVYESDGVSANFRITGEIELADKYVELP